MNRKLKIGLATGAAAAAIGGGAAIAGAGGDDDETEKPITGDSLQRASEAALEHAGEGRVTDTEVGDEEGHYEVEVTLDDGGQVDVHLDRDYNVVGEEGEEGERDDD